jgi:FAD/FMN-containing dehydrogenase
MLNQTLIESLKKIAGEENLRILSDRIESSPEDTLAISEIMKLANEEKLSVIPVGTGSILDWGNLLTGKGLLLKSSRLDKIKEVVAEDLYVILEPGFPLKGLNEKLQPYNLFYPLADKAWQGTAGGAVASNLKGQAKDRNLQTRDYVLALEVVDPQGEILRVGARTFKSVTGYDLPRLFVGSWGTLGLITEISLRLVPLGKRKDYENLNLEIPRRTGSRESDDYKDVLSSRIKKSLDPHGIFPVLQSIATKGR